MPGSKTTPGLAGARNDAPASVAFRGVNNVGTRVYNAFAAQWLAYTLPYRRFAVTLPVSRRTHSRCGLHTRAATNSWPAIPKASAISSPP